ncbi:META domain-containing protein [Marinospirillum insulare]|uniref:DUF306 domain-containing protein n=1 Tax=Marinospirillum insulare TaxID=217169 RepID=A0ABQ6A479_9GAMM|nr:META domain-containing protein [Marinospirillum insulare]GLR64910.1 hypothetical protein GCM10007878_23480 [Marinospirillum insulare]
MFKSFVTPALMTLTLGLVGCSYTTSQDSTSQPVNQEKRLEQLLGEWQIEDINGEGIIDSSNVTLTFDKEGRAFGSASCNRYSSDYQLTDEGLTFGHSLATKMACPEALMNQEQKFLETFNEISQFEINENGALILKSSNGKTLRGYLLGQ